jgi:hypothetical protein
MTLSIYNPILFDDVYRVLLEKGLVGYQIHCNFTDNFSHKYDFCIFQFSINGMSVKTTKTLKNNSPEALFDVFKEVYKQITTPF